MNGDIVAAPCRPRLLLPLAERENDPPFTPREGGGHEVTSACQCPRKQDKATVTVPYGGCRHRLTLGTQMAHDSGLCAQLRRHPDPG